MTSPQPGATARVSVAATSANLGPGFDALGLALDIRDSYEVEIAAGPALTVETVGECADQLPRDADHLVARALLTGLRAAGADEVGFRLRCRNAIPQGRGLGSSAAAIVGGLALADAVAGTGSPERLVHLASDLEGHPDNVAAAALGGLTISWLTGSSARAVSLAVHPDVRLALFVPEATSPTAAARAALPATVPHADAAANAGRAALLVAALTQSPDLLFDATADLLHQQQRRATYEQAMRLVDDLRARGHAAVVSGAGPAVLVLTRDPADAVATRVAGYHVREVRVGTGVALE